jgi:site-specific recombinase XerC
VLRGAGLRVGELLDLELGNIIDYGPAGSWLKVPLGKLATERRVPLSAATVAVRDAWIALRGAHGPLPHPRTGELTDFLFTQRGRRLGYTLLCTGLLAAAESVGLRAPDYGVITVTPHQRCHTWATELANAGMSLQVLMALLGALCQPRLRATNVAAFATQPNAAPASRDRGAAGPPPGRPSCACYTGDLFSWMESTDLNLGITATQVAATSGGIAKA